MPREPEGFREQLARLSERFPDRETITLREACDVLGRKDRRPLAKDKTFPAKKAGGKYMVPLALFARWLAS